MTDIVLSPITSGYNLSKINANFDKVEDAINNDVLHVRGSNNVMYQDLDMNSHALLNVKVDPNNPGSLLTVEIADQRYYNVSGDKLEGTMDVNSNTITGLRAPFGPTEAVRKLDLDNEEQARVNGDESLQDQLNGTIPPIGTAFSVISWHEQNIGNSIVIPPNKNAWSFGPVLTIDLGQVVTVGLNSFWTVANGAVSGAGALQANLPDPLDYGVL